MLSLLPLHTELVYRGRGEGNAVVAGMVGRAVESVRADSSNARQLEKLILLGEKQLQVSTELNQNVKRLLDILIQSVGIIIDLIYVVTQLSLNVCSSHVT